MLQQPGYRAIYQFIVGIWLALSIAGVVAVGVYWIRLSHSIAAVRHWNAGFLITVNTNGYVRKPFSPRELFDELAEFLPRNGAGDDSAPVEASIAPETDAGPVPDELLSQLRLLLADPWPALCNNMAVNETKTFACRLEILAERWHCKPLTAYAVKLRLDAETYTVNDLEKHLGEFDDLVNVFAQYKEKSLADESSGPIAPPPDAAGSAPVPQLEPENMPK